MVVNKIVASPTDIAPDGCFLVDVTGLTVDVGWFLTESGFVDPTAGGTE